MGFLNQVQQNSNPSYVIEILLMVGLNIGVYFVFSNVDMLEQLYNFSREHESYELDELLPLGISISLTLFIFASRRIKENRHLTSFIDEMALQDDSSGLYNRDYFLQILASELERRIRNGNELSILFIKLDGLDPDKDNTGEISAEQVMLELGKVVEGSCRDIDMAARWSQNEIILLCPDTRIMGANILADKIRDNFRSFQFPDMGRIMFDIGIAGAVDEKNPADLIYRAQTDIRKTGVGSENHS